MPTRTRRSAKAQALMYRAFEEPDEQRRVQLAKEALAICPDCADAYVLLAEHARSRKETLRLYEQGRGCRRTGAGARGLSARCRPLLGHPRNQAVHACPAGSGPFALDRWPA